MSAYRRAKKEDAIKPSNYELSISLGSVNDSLDILKTLCNDKACELKDSIELEKGKKLQVVFWTGDFPELIGVADFFKNENGLIVYSIDYSLSTIKK